MTWLASLLLCIPSPAPPITPIPSADAPKAIGHMQEDGGPKLDVTTDTVVTLDGEPCDWDEACKKSGHVRRYKVAADGRTLLEVDFRRRP